MEGRLSIKTKTAHVYIWRRFTGYKFDIINYAYAYKDSIKEGI